MPRDEDQPWFAVLKTIEKRMNDAYEATWRAEMEATHGAQVRAMGAVYDAGFKAGQAWLLFEQNGEQFGRTLRLGVREDLDRLDRTLRTSRGIIVDRLAGR